MRRSIAAILFAATAAFISACQTTEAPKPGTPANAPKPAASASPTDPTASPTADPKGNTPSAKVAELEGQWTGQGGSTLTIAKKGNGYSVEIKKGDKTENSDGLISGDNILFRRGDKIETIKAATPEETGMKWSGGEKKCVVVTKGTEAYCRK